MFIHNLDPFVFDFGFFAVRWYSLAYILGILIGWWYGKKIISNIPERSKENFITNDFDDLIAYLIISMIIGGRIGYVIFYNPIYYYNNPTEILKIWLGGMSFHGALIGIIVGTYYFAVKKNIKTFFLLDIIACVSPIGIFFGRIANFINGELVGKVSNISWSVIFPSIDMMPRHPSQLYEAFFEGLVLFLIMKNTIFKQSYKVGTCSYLFLIYYGIFRVFSEFFREPDEQLGYFFEYLSMGTILSIIMILAGLIILNFLKKNEKS